MAKTYKKTRYSGLRYFFREITHWIVTASRPTAIFLTALYLGLPWLLPLDPSGRTILFVLAIGAGIAALVWNQRAAKVLSTMDIMAAGHDGESNVAQMLKDLPKEWAVLNDLALKINGPIVQLDHLIISPTGIRVIETKTQKGRIISSPVTGRWQVKRRGETRVMTNPVEQNQEQLEACKNLMNNLGVNIPCQGLVVMAGSKARTNWPITSIERVNTYLLNSQKGKNPILSPPEIRKLAKRILKFQVKGRAPWQKGHEHFITFIITMLLPLVLYLALVLILLR